MSVRTVFRNLYFSLGLLASFHASHASGQTTGAGDPVLVPVIDDRRWQVAGKADLGQYQSPKQEDVDFAIWQAADGTWQILSCIRNVDRLGGHVRLLYRWEGAHLTDSDWKPAGIAMMADPKVGEALGGLQAPYVFKDAGLYQMVYGNWSEICRATSVDGKTFSRVLDANGKSAMFGDPEPTANARDPQVIKIGDTFYCYYSATPDKRGNADLCRTSTDLKTWSAPRRVASGGSAGTGRYTAECPFVVVHDGWYYLFRTQHYGAHAQTSVYRSRDPLDFGVDNDDHLVVRLPVAAPELFEDQGQLYIAALNGDLHGIWIAKIRWEPAK